MEQKRDKILLVVDAMAKKNLMLFLKKMKAKKSRGAVWKEVNCMIIINNIHQVSAPSPKNLKFPPFLYNTQKEREINANKW